MLTSRAYTKREIIAAYAKAGADRANAWCRGDVEAEAEAAARQRILCVVLQERARLDAERIAQQDAHVKAQYRT